MNLHFLNTLVPALLHTLWIGLLSAVGLFLALQILPAKRARLRYALGMVALLAIFLGGLVAGVLFALCSRWWGRRVRGRG